VTFATVVAVKCELNVGNEDVERLRAMARLSDPRFQGAGSALLGLVTGCDEYGNCVENPASWVDQWKSGLR
jgi:hypothetical protein